MKILFSVVLMCLSLSCFADKAPMAKMEQVGGNIFITFTDFADASGFESYECKVDFGSWIYTLSASKVVVNNQDMYRCTDQGILVSGVKYPVYFSFEDRPYNYISQTATFTLEAE